MLTIEFCVGELVYFLHDNKVYYNIIHNISLLNINRPEDGVTFGVLTLSGIVVTKDKVFKTKEDLLKSL